MRVFQKKYTRKNGWKCLNDEPFDKTNCDLVIVFGCGELLSEPELFDSIRSEFSNAIILLNSTAGEIYDIEVNDHTLSLTAISFEKTQLHTAYTEISNFESDSYKAGEYLGKELPANGLKNVFVISDGQTVNGSDLVRGIQNALPEGTIITGGLAGDGDRFSKTLVGLNETPRSGCIAAIGFYGSELVITSGSIGGWDPFGPERLVTRSKGNVLFELDNKPALDIYKLYLGEYARELPGSGLLFPLSLRTNGPGSTLVRTILAVSEEDNSLTFAGNMPEGAYARLMKANFERLIEGASTAAQNTVKSPGQNPDLAILISCVGRKLVLNQRIEEEIEVVRDIYGDRTAITGFYSYGEISPSNHFSKCELHNQTMTITTFTEL